MTQPLRSYSRSMIYRLLFRSAQLRQGRALTALVGIIVASAVATAMLNLYVDIDSKLTKEFSKFGANLIISARPGESLRSESLSRASAVLRPGDVVVPVAYAVAKASDGRPVVVVGTDLHKMLQLNSWWSITRASAQGAIPSVIVGERAASIFASDASSRGLNFGGRVLALPAYSLLHTGGPEDSRIYIPLPDFEKWTGVAPSTAEIYVSGSNAEISSAIERLQRALPDAQVRPIRQIVETETRVLDKTRSVVILSTIMIAIMVALCVLATLSASVLEQRKDFALMKALGSSQRAVNAIFISESLALGVVGSIIGFALGCGLAAWIGRINFHAAVVPRFAVFPPVFVGCLLLTLLSALLPLSRLHKLEPAVMLRGD